MHLPGHTYHIEYKISQMRTCKNWGYLLHSELVGAEWKGLGVQGMALISILGVQLLLCFKCLLELATSHCSQNYLLKSCHFLWGFGG